MLPIMRAQGSGVIINNASDWGLVGARDAVAYAASKGAVIQMTRCMALDHAKENIRVNAVCPGDTFVERWIQQGYFRGSGAVDEATARQSDTIPLGRVAEAKEIARAVLFLASDDSSFVTGAAWLWMGETLLNNKEAAAKELITRYFFRRKPHAFQSHHSNHAFSQVHPALHSGDAL